ncbi:uncharacterized protein TA20890 [Theileria annulata]|uniref:Lon N-terminal domain-containing protein n=1 Tax=Theileria annulata TaxID=5874 RepID=Q4UGX7_THEAN|nr:uncharacterized protein TA20890 [Theileria annulata]CAI73662.1 hypothetical protein, conserved [Theileria annulata]|eukprot:XP_954339.1 hypothetical protein, conserved [Theileria annulata]
MFMCRIFSIFCTNVLIAVSVELISGVNCIFKESRHTFLTPKFTFISNNSTFSAPSNKNNQISYKHNLKCDKKEKFKYNSKNIGFDIESENLTGVSTTDDYKSTSESLEKENVDFIDNLNNVAGTASQVDSPDNNYFDWQSIRDLPNSTNSTVPATLSAENPEIKTVVNNLDGESRNDVEEGEKPLITGSGLNSELKVEDYEIGVDNGRINEWPVEWVPGRKVLSFFPILIDQYSVNPNPIQIGFEDTIRFRGKHVESTFNSILDNLNDKQIFGLCFLSPESMQLAPLAVYAQLISKETVVDGSGENLLVTGRVLGRALINKVILDEPFIKALVSPYEDEPALHDADNIPKIVDEIVNLYDSCNTVEAEIMQLLQQPYAHLRVKNRTKLMDIIDDRLNKFNINNNVNQGFAQIAAYAAFDYHLNASERYDALAMQNTEDRLRFVRDTLKFKAKQLGIVKNSPKDRLEDLVKHLKNFQNDRDSLYSIDSLSEAPNAENVTANSNSQ